VVAGVGAVILVGGGDPTPGALPAAEQPTDGVGLPVDEAVGDRVPEPPLLQVHADGWTMTSFAEEIGAGNGAGTPSSILAPIDSLDRWIRFTELPGDFPPTTLPFDAATDTYLLLTTGDGTLVGAESWGFDGATFQQIAIDALTSGTVPDGYEYHVGSASCCPLAAPAGCRMVLLPPQSSASLISQKVERGEQPGSTASLEHASPTSSPTMRSRCSATRHEWRPTPVAATGTTPNSESTTPLLTLPVGVAG